MIALLAMHVILPLLFPWLLRNLLTLAIVGLLWLGFVGWQSVTASRDTGSSPFSGLGEPFAVVQLIAWAIGFGSRGVWLVWNNRSRPPSKATTG
ncbi:hypothetical protein [Rhodoplanes azumiensis]|uniref:Uncharacterized protein n=1 Tax=Rhodoplanes azumiensis TaxID=1897628 RepID=A0ABW5AK84_9BRAD